MKNKFEEYSESFLEYISYELNYTKKTASTYKQVLIKYEKFLNNRDLLKVNNDISVSYKAYLLQSGLSNKTASLHLSAIRSFYNFLIEIEAINTNPFLNLKNPKVPKKLPNFLKKQETEKILESNRLDDLEIRNALIVEFLYATGLRVSELCNIKLNDINESDGTIKILGKGNKERIIFFNACNKELFDLYLNKVRNNILDNIPSEYLFISKRGKNLTTRTVENIVKEYALKSGIKTKVSPHTLRHTYATDLLDNGADIRSVGELLGHSSLSTTGIYTHVTSATLKSAYKKTHPRGNMKK